MRDLKGDELSYVYGAGAPAKPQHGNKFHSSKKRNKTSSKKRKDTSNRKHSKRRHF